MLRFTLLGLTLIFSHGIFAGSISPADYTSVEPKKLRDTYTFQELVAIVKKQKALESKSAQVILLPFGVNSAPSVKRDGGALKGLNALKIEVIKGGAEIVDRDLPDKVKDELAYIEASGTSRGVSSSLADFLFNSEVLESGNSKRFSESYTYESDGKTKRAPSSCKLNATATVAVNFYSMNPLERKDSLVLKGNASEAAEGISSSRCASKDASYLEVAAVKSAVAKGSAQIRNLFAPVGYITDLRYAPKGGNPKTGRKMIFRTSLSSSLSAKKGAQVVVYKEIVRNDAFTGERTVERGEVGRGKIIEVSGTKEVWIKMNKSAQAAQVHLGDIVKIDHKCKGFMCTVKGFANP